MSMHDLPTPELPIIRIFNSCESLCITWPTSQVCYIAFLFKYLLISRINNPLALIILIFITKLHVSLSAPKAYCKDINDLR